MKRILILTLAICYMIGYSNIQAQITSDQIVCDNYADIAADISYGTNIQWTANFQDITFLSPNSFQTQVFNLHEGTNSLSCTYTNSSGQVKTKVIQLIYFIASANAGRDKPVCNDEVFLDAQEPTSGSGVWTRKRGGGNILSPDFYGSKVTGLERGENIFVWTVTQNSCTKSDEVVITNNSFDVNAGDDKEVCNNEASLSGSPLSAGATGKWEVLYGRGVITNDQSSLTTIKELGIGTSTLTWTVTKDECTISDVVLITNSALEISAGGEQHRCEEYTFLTGTAPYSHLTGKWTVEEGSGSFVNDEQYNTRVDALGKGKNVFKWTINSVLCEASAEVVIYNDIPPTPEAGDNEAICSENIQLSASPPGRGTGKWISYGNAVVANETLYNTQVSHLAKNANTFEWIVTIGECSASDRLTVSNISTIATAPTDRIICENEISLYGGLEIGATGEWTVVEGKADIVNPANPLSTMMNLQKGKNILRWTATKNICSAYDDVEIYNNSPDDAVILSQGGTICTDNMTLKAVNPVDGTGEWSIDGGAGVIEAPTLHNTNIYDMQNGLNRIYWKVSKDECTKIDFIEINNNMVFAFAGNDKEICGSVRQMLGSALKEGETGRWSRYSGGGLIDNEYQPDTYIRDLHFGENLFIWKVNSGICSAADTVMLTNRYPTDAIAPDDFATCMKENLISANRPIFGQGKWEVVSGNATFEDGTKYYTIVSDLLPGINTLRWKIFFENSNLEECKTEDQVVITNNAVEAYAGPDVTLCGNTYNMNAETLNTNIRGEWRKIDADADIKDYYSGKTLMTDIRPGENIFEWKITYKECISTDQVTITNNLIPATTDSDLGNVCKENKPYLIGSDPLFGKGVWKLKSGAAHIVSPSQMISRVMLESEGTSIFQWKIDAGNCSNFSDMKMNYNPVYAYAGDDETICSTNTALLKATEASNATTKWTVIEGNARLEDANNASTTASNLSDGINKFVWHVSKNNCSDRDTVTIYKVSLDASLPKKEVTTCDSEYPLDAPLITGVEGRWTIFGGVAEDINNPKAIVTELSVGKTTAIWTLEKDGCVDSDTLTIISEGFTTSAGPDQTRCENIANLQGLISEDARVLGAVGRWSVLEGAATFDFPEGWGDRTIDPATVNIAVAKNLKPGLNRLKWTLRTDECERYDVVEIQNNTINYSAGTNIKKCANSCELNAEVPQANGIGYWSTEDDQVMIADTLDANSGVTDLKSGTTVFYWNVKENGCSSKNIVEVLFRDLGIEAGDYIETTKDTITVVGAPLNAGGNWRIIGTSDATVNSNGSSAFIHSLRYGYNRVEWEVSRDGCTVKDTLIVAKTFTLSGGSDQEICNKVAYMNAQTSTIGIPKWELVEGEATIEDAYSPTTTLSNIWNKDVIMRWQLTVNEYTAYDDVLLTNTVRFKPNKSIDVCEPNGIASVHFFDNILNGKWSLIEGTGTIHDYVKYYTSVSGLSEGRNVFRFTATIGECSNYSDAVVNFYAIPEAIIFPNSTVVCNHKHTMSAQEPSNGSGRWSVIKGGATIDNDTLLTANFSNLSAGNNTIRWTISKGDCSTNDEVSIRYNPIAATLVNVEKSKCYNDNSGTAMYMIEKGTPPYSVEGFEVEQVADNYMKVIKLSANDFSFIITDSKQCSSTNINLKVEGPLEPIIIELDSYQDETFANNSKDGFIKINSSGGTPPYFYRLNDITYTSSNFTGLSSGNYHIEAIDKNQCRKEVFINIADGTVGVDQLKEAGNSFKVFPNPAKDYVLFSGDNKTSSSIAIAVYSIAGQLLFYKQIPFSGSYEYQWNTEQYPSGLYIVRLTAGANTNYQKLIIKK